MNSGFRKVRSSYSISDNRRVTSVTNTVKSQTMCFMTFGSLVYDSNTVLYYIDIDEIS